MSDQKFKLKVVVLCGNRAIGRKAYWPDKPSVGELIYMQPDMVAKVIRVLRFTSERLWWEVITVPWEDKVMEDPAEVSAQPFESGWRRMQDMLKDTVHLKSNEDDGVWIGPWEENAL